MPTYQFEAMDSTGQEIKDVIDAASQEEAQATIRQMGYFITKIAVKKQKKAATDKAKTTKKRGFAIGRVSTKVLCGFTRQLSILQDAGLPILRMISVTDWRSSSSSDTSSGISGGTDMAPNLIKAS